MKAAIARFSTLCWSVAVIGLSSSCTSLQLPDRAVVYQEVFYLTVRKESESDKSSSRYTGDRGPPSYGVCLGLIIDRTVCLLTSFDQRVHDGRIGQGGRVAQGRLVGDAFGDLAKNTTHDLARTGLRQ